MKNIFTTLTLIVLGTFVINAQEYIEISTGASYDNQLYYTFDQNQMTTINNNSWDIAFRCGATDAGILINESAGLSLPNMQLWLAPSNDFSETIDPITLTDSLYNASSSWEDGAFNSAKDENDPLDYGWGAYNFMNHKVEGTRVFALRLRDDSWKKIKVDTLTNGTYYFTYADLDGANENSVAIEKAAFGGSDMALFSFTTETAVASPQNWDFVYQRYYTPLDAGGTILQYGLTGILSAPGVEVAQANNIDPYDIDFNDYLDSLDTNLEIIGSDWKRFDLSTFTWSMELERVYFVKLPDNHLWKAYFIDFEGASTGTATMEKTDLGILSSTNDPASNFEEFGVYPNPIQDNFTVSFTVKDQRENLSLNIVNMLGQNIWQKQVNANNGLNVFEFTAPQVAQGMYTLVVGDGKDSWTSTIYIR